MNARGWPRPPAADRRVEVVKPILARMSHPRTYAGDYWGDQARRVLAALDTTVAWADAPGDALETARRYACHLEAECARLERLVHQAAPYVDRTPVECSWCTGNGEVLVAGDPRSDCATYRLCPVCGGRGEVDPWEGVYDTLAEVPTRGRTVDEKDPRPTAEVNVTTPAPETAQDQPQVDASTTVNVGTETGGDPRDTSDAKQ